LRQDGSGGAGDCQWVARGLCAGARRDAGRAGTTGDIDKYSVMLQGSGRESGRKHWPAWLLGTGRVEVSCGGKRKRV